MRIDVGDLLKKIGNETRVKSRDPVSFPQDGLLIKDPVEVNVRLVNIGGSVLVDGTFKATVILNCVRCLKDYESPVTVAIEEEYGRAPKVSALKDDEIELFDKDFVFPIEDDNAIDLDEAIRQNLLVALPIKPLCKKACRGLEDSKPKVVSGIDPRLAKLKDLLKK